MSKRDPAVRVLAYFQTAELSAATLLLRLAREAVQARTPKKPKLKPQPVDKVGA